METTRTDWSPWLRSSNLTSARRIVFGFGLIHSSDDLAATSSPGLVGDPLKREEDQSEAYGDQGSETAHGKPLKNIERKPDDG